MLIQIQAQIEKLYQLRCEHSVEDFVLREEDCKSYSAQKSWMQNSDEILFVKQEEENVDIGLFLNPKLLEKFSALNLNQTTPLEITQLAPLIEGVSHFVYLLWKSGKDQSVTQLELELQAEIDKFLLTSSLWGKNLSPWIMEQLFGEVEWNPHLGAEEKERYQVANQLASKYCAKLRNLFNIENSEEEILTRIRPFYQMNQGEKIRCIQSL